MPALASHHRLTVEEYLEAELVSPIRHEFVDGQVFAMTGASLRHNAIVLNLAVLLRAHLKGSPCRVFVEGVKVRVANAFYYPDVMVACSEKVRRLPADEYVVTDPLLLVEVLSPSTKAVDRREKLLAYRKLPSLSEYLLVSQNGGSVTLHRRVSDLHWDEITYSPGEHVHLASVELTIPFADIYEDLPDLAIAR